VRVSPTPNSLAPTVPPINFFDIMLSTLVRTVLQEYTISPPENETRWYGPWLAILNFLFPASQDYIVTPIPYFPLDNHQPPYVAFEVSQWNKPCSPPWRPLLIVAVMHSQDWRAGIPSLETKINRLIDAAFSGETRGGTAISTVYWMGVIGPHWRFGVKEENGQEAKQLIDWHHTAHDEVSFDDFQRLAALVAKMM
jgi:hypothetical protein